MPKYKELIQDIYVQGSDLEEWAEVTHKVSYVNHQGLKLKDPVVLTSINDSEFLNLRIPSIEEFKEIKDA